MKKLLYIFVLSIVLSACNQAQNEKQANMRITLFKECMELSVKMPRLSDDNVSEIVDSCSNQAYYMSINIK